jgi:hypothetical protein
VQEFIPRSKLIAADLMLRKIEAMERGNIQRRPMDLTQGRTTLA